MVHRNTRSARSETGSRRSARWLRGIALLGSAALVAVAAVPMATSATAAPKSRPKSVSGLSYTVSDTINMGGTINGLATSPNGKLYAAMIYTGEVKTVDIATNAVGTPVAIPAGFQLYGLTMGYDDTLYLGMRANTSGYLARINTLTDTFDDSVMQPLFNPQRQVVLGDDTVGDDSIYTVSTFTPIVQVFDAAPFAYDGSLATGFNSGKGIAASRDDTVYVTDGGSAVSVIEGATRTLDDSVVVGGDPQGIAVTEDDTVYVASDDSNAVQVINGRTNTLEASIATGTMQVAFGAFGGVTYDPVFKRVYVANYGAGAISVINTVTNTVDETIDLEGKKPTGSIAVSADGSRVFVATCSASCGSYVPDGLVTVINVSATPPAPPAPAPVYPPGPPTQVTAVAGDASADVTWTAPTYAGSFPITHYQVTASPGGRMCVASAPALTCSVSDLTNGMAYTFRARALNGAGWGAESEPSNAVTPGKSAGPSIVITGTRDSTDTRYVSVRGEARHLTAREVTPWVKFPGQAAFTEGQSRPKVASDGTFTWSRKTNRKVYVYFAAEGVESNQVVISAR